jgi:hypothetical protein
MAGERLTLSQILHPGELCNKGTTSEPAEKLIRRGVVTRAQLQSLLTNSTEGAL